MAGHVDQPNQFQLGHVSFLTSQNIENTVLILKNFPFNIASYAQKGVVEEHKCFNR